jgi:hypothetical protein
MTPQLDHRPEQLQALGYARRRGSESPVAEIRARVANTYRDIEALVAAVPAETARRRPAEGAWSVLEVVDHLVVSDEPAAAQLADLLAGHSRHDVIPASLQSPGANELDWDDLRRRFATVHATIVGLLATASDDLPIAATAPVEMVVKCAAADGSRKAVHWIERFDWKAFAILLHAHNREHIGQIERTLARLRGA